MICGRSYSLTCDNNSVTLSAYDTEINISDVKNISENKANILWGESKRITSSSPCFFINRYNSSKNGISLYYSECQITINNNGMSVICDYR